MTLLAAVVTVEGGGAGTVDELDVCDWLLAVVAGTVADKDSGIDDEGDVCGSFKCLPRTMSDTVGRVPVPLLSSPPLEVM